MSSRIWTPQEVASNAVPLTLQAWRAVEAQHNVSTTRLVDSLEEQQTLEALVEQSKPPLPTGTSHLDYLLATPFRYRPPHGSRFRAWGDPGVFYCAPNIRTALAEAGYWRWRFLRESSLLSEIPPVAHTVFQAEIRGTAIDLMRQPFVIDRPAWTHGTNYSPTQALANSVRQAGVSLIVYESVRDPEHDPCVAAMTPAAFANPRPVTRQTWFCRVSGNTTTWMRNGDASFEFQWSE